jgi:hypothetical protein
MDGSAVIDKAPVIRCLDSQAKKFGEFNEVPCCACSAAQNLDDQTGHY